MTTRSNPEVEPPDLEDPRYLQEQIITYIGNKRALLPFIGRGVEAAKRALGKPRLAMADLFSGTGIVARYLKQHAESLLVNDLETYSRITNECYLANAGGVELGALAARLAELEIAIAEQWAPGFLTELYAPPDENAIRAEDRVFYTRRNATYLDTARQAIGALSVEEQPFFLGPLLARASVHANTAGVFKGFYRGRSGAGEFGGAGRNALGRILGEVRVELPILSRFECGVSIVQRDANVLARDMPAVDLAYLDPPYNQHPYGSNYFMLNLIADYRRPTVLSPVSGIPADWNRSRYNRRGEVEDALFDLVRTCPAKFLLVSYNSEGFIGPERFRTRLAESGEVTVLEMIYQAFRGSRNLRNRALRVTEFLFLLKKR